MDLKGVERITNKKVLLSPLEVVLGSLGNASFFYINGVTRLIYSCKIIHSFV